MAIAAAEEDRAWVLYENGDLWELVKQEGPPPLPARKPMDHDTEPGDDDDSAGDDDDSAVEPAGDIATGLRCDNCSVGASGSGWVLGGLLVLGVARRRR